MSITLACPIAMESRMLGHAGGTGVSSYARELERAIAGLTDTPLLVSDAAPPALPGRAGRWLRALSPLPRRARARGKARVSPDVFRLAQVFFDVHRRPLPLRLPGPPGIVHWTYPVPIHAIGWANLYTVHDLIPLTHPALTPIDPRRHRRLLAALTARAAGIVTVSQASAREIADLLGCGPGFIHDCGEAVEPAPSDAGLPAGLVPGGYLLAVGAIDPRKNLARLAAAHAASGTGLPLVLAGPDGRAAAGLAAALARPGIVRLGYCAEPVVRALIGHARALAMPSLAEGFGLPVAEAMALGTPVLTAHRGALSEIAGDAALLVDPEDEHAIARAIAALARDDALCARLRAAGLRNARRFGRARFVARLRETYASVAGIA